MIKGISIGIIVLVLGFIFVLREADFFLADEAELVFVGDIMLSRQIGKIIEEKGVDYPFELIRDDIKRADVAFGNLESPISDKGIREGSIYSFRADPKVMGGLVNAGFDVLSLANNHALDYGREALFDTKNRLNAVGIYTVGVGVNKKEAHVPVMVEKSNTKLGFLAYSEFAREDDDFPVARIDVENIRRDIYNLKQRVDIIVVSFHWGEEYQTMHNSFQEKVARAAVDAGADIVVGHHPHVIQGMKKYGGGIIAYSLGNFVFDQNFSDDTGRGLLLRVTLKDRKIAKVESVRLRFTREFQAYIAD